MITIIKKEETFRSDGYVYGTDCGDDFTNAMLSPNSWIWNTLNMYGFFYVNHASKVALNMFYY